MTHHPHFTTARLLRQIALQQTITLVSRVPSFAYLASMESVPKNLSYRVTRAIAGRAQGEMTFDCSPDEAEVLLKAALFNDLPVWVETEYRC